MAPVPVTRSRAQVGESGTSLQASVIHGEKSVAGDRSVSLNKAILKMEKLVIFCVVI